MPPVPSAFSAASARFVDECLRRGTSLFTPGKTLWEPRLAAELHRRFVGNPDLSKADFVQKLRGQLDGAEAEVVQLAAEVFYVLLLPQDSSAETKRHNLTAVLDSSPEPVALPVDLDAALAHGMASYGAALSQRFSQYAFLLEFTRSWTGLDDDGREQRLSEPGLFREFVYSLPRKGASSQVEALLHMVFPAAYEPIVSVDVKQRIVEAFSEYVGDPSVPLDVQIAEIRRGLTPEYHEGFSFYDQEVRARWEAPTPPSAPGRAWLIRGANDRGTNRIPAWLASGFISIGWEESVHARPAMAVEELAQVIEADGLDESSPARVRMGAGNLERFFDRMRPGDLVLTVEEDNVYIGRLAGGPVQRGTAEDGAVWQRDVEWLNASSPIKREGLPGPLHSSLRTQITLTDISRHLAALRDLIGAGAPDPYWDEFLRWAQKLYERTSFDREERNYKLEAARLLAEVRRAMTEGGDWIEALDRTLGGDNNLLYWGARDTLLAWCTSEPEMAKVALGQLWSQGISTEDEFDAFAEKLPTTMTPGNRVTVASLLLMSGDSGRFPPFRAGVDAKARKLLGISCRARQLEIAAGRTFRPEELGAELGASGRTVRALLRRRFPRKPEEKHAPWELDAETARAVVEHLTPSSSNATPGARYFAFLDLNDELRDRLLERGVALRDRLDAQSLLWWITSGEPPADWTDGDCEAFRMFQQGRPIVTPGVPSVPEELSQRLHVPRVWLQEAVDLLNEKRQLVFYGPPGTGKTYVAQALGEHVQAAGGEWQLVQFHPAYGYEDFFEGYRPRQGGGGGLEFVLQKGPLRLLVERALQKPENPHLLVIDEINRGNIAKIFGELYFLLEYRNHPIRLQYSPEEEFELPENLYLIGTMNTADRSIALVDSALRRRFYFFPFQPNEPPVEGVLASWLVAKGFDDEPARLLAALNAAIQEALPNDEFAIGPSYFMPRDGPPRLERVWDYAIQPLLEERFYGTRSAVEIKRDFGLDAMRRRLQKVEPEEEAGEEPSAV